MTPQRQAILDLLADDETVMFFEPEALDVAIVGLTCAQPGRERCVAYDYARVLACYRKQMGDDAEEWVSFNTLGAYVGPTTPLVVTTVKGARRRC